MFKAILAALIAASLLLVSCSGGSGQPTAQATQQPSGQAAQQSGKPVGPVVGQPGQSVTIPGTGGQSVTVDTSLPSEFAGFPVPPGFAYDSGGSLSVSGKEGGKTTVASWKGKATLADAMSFYKQNAASKGWTEGMSFSDNKGGQLWFTTKDNYSYIVTLATRDDGALEISVLGGQSNWPTPAPTRAPVVQATKPPAAATSAPAQPQATPATARPATVAVSQMPQELQALPLPSGFAPLQDGMMRLTSGNQLQTATTTLVGTGEPKQIAEFYKGALPGKGWAEELTMSTGQGVLLSFTGQVGGADFALNIAIEKKDAGTEVVLMLVPQ